MPEQYPISQLLAEMMAVVQDAMPYLIPAAIISASIALMIRWFMYAINIGDWTFGGRR